MSLQKECEQCGELYQKPKRYSFKDWGKRRFCSHKCYWECSKGKPSRSPETTFKKGEHPSPKTEFKKGHTPWITGKRGIHTGNKNPAWKGGLQFRKKDRLKAYDSAYKEWMLAIKKRDNWKCKIANQDCSGRLEAHHILNWIDYPELRYDINNGITLCQAHHPRKRAEEKRLVIEFRELIKVS